MRFSEKGSFDCATFCLYRLTIRPDDGTLAINWRNSWRVGNLTFANVEYSMRDVSPRHSMPAKHVLEECNFRGVFAHPDGCEIVHVPRVVRINVYDLILKWIRLFNEIGIKCDNNAFEM